MTIREVRNIIVRRLHDHIERPVVLHDQTGPEPEAPLLYYQLVSPLMPVGGANIWTENGTEYYSALVEATVSITAVAYDNEPGDQHISGDDEALDLAERAFTWFGNIGRVKLRLEDIAVIDIGNVQNRSNLMINEVARQYGFDVRLRFQSTSVRSSPGIAGGIIIC